MALVEAKCTNCGAKLEVDNTKEAAICPSCNSPFIVEKAINNITNNITNENNISNSNVNIYQEASVLLTDGCYDGETNSGKPHGKGTCVYTDGSKYEGEWFVGERSGKGTIYYEDGKSWSGSWKNNLPYTGDGTIVTAHYIYEGAMKNGKKDGQGKIVYSNGEQWSGIWKKGEEWTGEGHKFFLEDDEPTGQLFIGKITDGVYDETGEWHFNGRWNGMDIVDDELTFTLHRPKTLVIPMGVRKLTKGLAIPGVRTLKLPLTVEKISIDNFKLDGDLECIEGIGIKQIQDNLFEGWDNLKAVNFPNATKIGVSAFDGCTGLEKVILPSVTKIGPWAFHGCENLTYVDIPKVKTITENAFAFCDLSEYFNIPCVEIIESSGCENTKIKKLNAPKLKHAGESAFYDCSYLKDVCVPNLEVAEENSFRLCEILKTFESLKLKSIGVAAFMNCTNLTTVNCPNAILEVEKNAKRYNNFVGCENLNDITLSSTVDTSKIIKKELPQGSGGCYVATCVYGSYDCPEVWTLRRYRDNTLASTWYGRVFIKTYYAISPTFVKWFGNASWFKYLCKGKLDKMINKLQSQGVDATPYEDSEW